MGAVFGCLRQSPWGFQKNRAMVRLLGYNSQVGLDSEESPREILKTPSAVGDNGWLIRFFDSAFFCEWIAISYLYKHDHQGVRDFLCNRMYTLPLSGIENYLFQLCFMLLHKSSPALEKFMVDGCSKSLRIALKVHWFISAEAEEADDAKEFKRLLEKFQMAALMGDWPPLVRPKKTETSPSSKSRMFKLLSSSRLLNLSGSPPQKVASPIGASVPVIEEEMTRSPSEDVDSSLKVLKKLMPGPKVRDAFLKKFQSKDDDDVERPKEGESDSFFRRLLREKDEEKGVRTEELVSTESFFRRIFKDKLETEDKVGNKIGEEDGFFRRLFRDKSDDREKGDDRERHDEEEKGVSNLDEEDGPEFFLFRRFFRVHPEEDDKAMTNLSEAPISNTSENSPGTDGFFKRLFRDRNLEDSKIFNLRREDGMSPSSILRKLFKDRSEDLRATTTEDTGNAGDSSIAGLQKETQKVAQLPVKNGLDDIRSLRETDWKVENRTTDAVLAMNGSVAVPVGVDAKSIGQKNSPSAPLSCSTYKAHANSVNVLFSNRPGSPKQTTEKSAAKPPLPKYSFFHLRKGTYHATLDFVQSLCDISTGLVDVYPMEDRRKSLHESLVELNTHLVIAQNDGGVCFPLGKGLYRIMHIVEDEATLLNSREKAPYLICMEVLKCDEQGNTKDTKDTGSNKSSRKGIPLANGDVQLQRPPPWAYPVWNQTNRQRNNTDAMLRAASQAIDRAMTHLWETKVKFVHVSLSVTERRTAAVNCNGGQSLIDKEHLSGGTDCKHNGRGGLVEPVESVCQTCTECHQPREDGDAVPLEEEWVSVLLTAVPGVNMEDIEDEDPVRRKDHRRVPSTIAMAQVKAAAAKGEAPLGLTVKKSLTGTTQSQSEEGAGSDGKATDALAGELWEVKKERIRKTSKFGNMSGWDLRSVIVKSGDDCRQEHLAVQLISHFYDIFQEAGLPLWLRPYEVLVTSSYTALIETIPDTASIHAIKSRNPGLSSLRDFFCTKYQDDSPAFKLAQRNFVESMAGYSILCYFLQVKDRHNGNLLLDEEGHIIHIDFGFMLSNSPGGVNFESAPFKLTRELLEVMDSDAEGTASEFFDYFKVLCIQGFLTCRKHAERIILLVEMMQDSGFPCFKSGAKAIQNLRKRFHLSLTEEQCVSLVLSLISSSLDAWRTRQYDYYQRVLNGIL